MPITADTALTPESNRVKPKIGTKCPYLDFVPAMTVKTYLIPTVCAMNPPAMGPITGPV
jgi:hypothetical protein